MILICIIHYEIHYVMLNLLEDLQKYPDNKLCQYIKEQLVYFPNGSSITDKWIVKEKHIFDDIIVHNQISHTGLPPLLQADAVKKMI